MPKQRRRHPNGLGGSFSSLRTKLTRSAPYIYSPLDEAAGEIRVLTLLPGPKSAKVRVLLETSRLTPDFVPQYGFLCLKVLRGPTILTFPEQH